MFERIIQWFRRQNLAKISAEHNAQACFWSDDLLISRFIIGCSRTGSVETPQAYKRDLEHFLEWRDRRCPGLKLWQLNSHLIQEYIDNVRELVETEKIKPRTYNRRLAACSALYIWASDPCRSSVTGIAFSPIPRRKSLPISRRPRSLHQKELDAVFKVIELAAQSGDQKAKRDYVLVRATYLLGARVSEIARLRWKDIEPLKDGGQVHLHGKGNKPRTLRVHNMTLDLFESLGRGEPDEWVFPSNRSRGHLTRQGIGHRMHLWGQKAGVSFCPTMLRHTHATQAIRRGVDIFTLQKSLGHKSAASTEHYVEISPNTSSSLSIN